MAVENAGDGGVDGRVDVFGKRRLHPPCLDAGDDVQILDAVFAGAGENVFQAAGFIGMGDDELAAIPVGDAVVFKIGVELAAPFDAEAGFQRVFRVIEPRMDDF